MNDDAESQREADSEESLEMLKTPVGQKNAVFACFGSAAQHAQLFELALTEFLQEYNKVSKRAISSEDFELFDQKLQKKTMGALLNEFSKYVTIKDQNVTKLLDLALEKRNYLMHHFFREKSESIVTEDGRMSLISELVWIDKLLTDAGTITRAMRIAFSEALSKKESIPGDEKGNPGTDQRGLFALEVELPSDGQVPIVKK